ncbi:MAG: redoxin domain-containing protein [Bryobacteraceae bacterium]|nr:redoxin domain-containing protein [Bryobacteraceae bacterium]
MRILALVLALAVPALATGSIERLTFEAAPATPVTVEMKDSALTAVLFLSALCPMSVDYSERITDLHRRYAERGVRLILVNANAHESDTMVEQQRQAAAIPLAVWRDRGARVAVRLQVFATPTAVLLDRQGAVRYWGAIDDSRSPTRVRRRYLEDALQALLTGESPALSRTKVMGCAIKAE